MKEKNDKTDFENSEKFSNSNYGLLQFRLFS